MHLRPRCILAVSSCLLVLSACTDIPTERVQTTTPATALEIETPVTATTTTTVNPAPWYRAVEAQQRWFAIVRWYENAAAAKVAVRADRGADNHPPAAAAAHIEIGTATNERCAYASLIRSVWLSDADWAVGIAWRESNCQPGAVSPDNALGLFQLLGHDSDFRAVGCDPSQWSDPSCNVRAAWHLYGRAGRQPWHL